MSKSFQPMVFARVYLARQDSPHPTSTRVLISSSWGQVRPAEPQRLRLIFRKGQANKARAALVPHRSKKGGRTNCGYGAPGKGNTLLNYCGIGIDFLDFTVDRNPHKHGRYTPGMHIPIRPTEEMPTARPDYILILPWNLKNEIVAQMDYVVDWGAKFVLPIPTVAIIDPRA